MSTSSESDSELPAAIRDRGVVRSSSPAAASRTPRHAAPSPPHARLAASRDAPGAGGAPGITANGGTNGLFGGALPFQPQKTSTFHRGRRNYVHSESDPLLSYAGSSSNPHNYIPTLPQPTRFDGSWSGWLAGLLISSRSYPASYSPSPVHNRGNYAPLPPSSVSSSSTSLGIPPPRPTPPSHRHGVPIGPRVTVARPPPTTCQKCIRPFLVVLLISLVLALSISNPLMIPPTPVPLDPVRLPKSVVPSLYSLYIQLLDHPQNATTFNGSVSILLSVIDKNTNNITLHAHNDLNLSLSTIRVEIQAANTRLWGGESTALQPTSTAGNNTKPHIPAYIPTSIIRSHTSDTLTILFKDALPVGDGVVQLSINYTGVLHSQSRGFYKNSYVRVADNTTGYLFATHFQPSMARRAFPCFDEPALKAAFQVSVAAPSSIPVVLSNYPLEQSIDVEPATKVWRFQKTRPMSSYLVAWALGDFALAANGTTDTGVPVRVYSQPGREAEGSFALDVAVASVGYYEKRLGAAFPAPKLDLLPMPVFGGEAMENLGLCVFEDGALMRAEGEGSTMEERLYTAGLVAHEIAHHGFANWAQYLPLKSTMPDWGIHEFFFDREHETALELDGSSWTRPVRLESVDPTSFSMIFDDITYCKGASVIRMIQMWSDRADDPSTSLSLYRNDEVCGRFCRAVKRYVNLHINGATISKDLYSAIDYEEPSGLVSRAMKTFVEAEGYPYIEKKGNGELVQKRFTLWDDRDKTVMPQKNATWVIPLGYRWISTEAKKHKEEGETNNDAIKFVVMKPETVMTIPMAPITIPRPVMLPNPDRAGFFRYLHSDDDWSTFISLMRPDSEVLSMMDRAGLVSDAMAFLLSNRLDPSIALKVMQRARDERHPAIWGVVSRWATNLMNVMALTNGLDAVRLFVADVVEPVIAEVGFPIPGRNGSKSASPFEAGILRPIVLDLGVAVGRRSTLRECSELVDLIQASGKVPDAFRGLLGTVLKGAVAFDAFGAVDRLMAADRKVVGVWGGYEEEVVAAMATSTHRSHHEMVVGLIREGMIGLHALTFLAEGSETGHVVAWREIKARSEKWLATPVASRTVAEIVEAVVARMEGRGLLFMEAADMVESVGTGGDLHDSWKMKVDDEPWFNTALRKGLERAWAAEEFRKARGNEVVDAVWRLLPGSA
ncbi:hypothetical protein HK101_004646 [Irineochytrium annulatum]|nr:hypothetical protein HK101_004646 [Irineochytrium annulatum]